MHTQEMDICAKLIDCREYYPSCIGLQEPALLTGLQSLKNVQHGKDYRCYYVLAIMTILFLF